jgi:pantoate--beta-alanine ligase
VNSPSLPGLGPDEQNPKPSRTYFGQKDIQQALLLRRMCTDLHMTFPDASTLHIVPTTRDAITGLALSSRNAYLSPVERLYAPALYAALCVARDCWGKGATKGASMKAALDLVEARRQEAQAEQVVMKLDFVELNDSINFEPLRDEETSVSGGEHQAVLLSGAMWVGKTRLIDNLVLGNIGSIIY